MTDLTIDPNEDFIISLTTEELQDYRSIEWRSSIYQINRNYFRPPFFKNPRQNDYKNDIVLFTW